MEESLLWEARPLTRQYPWHQERASWCCQHPDRWPAVRILIARDSSLIICAQSNGTVLKQNIFWWEKKNDITKKKKAQSKELHWQMKETLLESGLCFRDRHQRPLPGAPPPPTPTQVICWWVPGCLCQLCGLVRGMMGKAQHWDQEQ